MITEFVVVAVVVSADGKLWEVVNEEESADVFIRG